MGRDRCPEGFHADAMARGRHRCGRCDRKTGLQLSHKVARSRGGPWRHYNIDLLCLWCHQWAEEHPRAAVTEGWRVDGRLLRGVYLGPDDDFAALVAADAE